MVTVVLLVALRLGLGCHFLYEGVWKIKHQDEFTAEAVFLTQAKGPAAGMFYSMIPDLDGRQRLQADLTIKSGKSSGEKRVKDKPLDRSLGRDLPGVSRCPSSPASRRTTRRIRKRRRISRP